MESITSENFFPIFRNNFHQIDSFFTLENNFIFKNASIISHTVKSQTQILSLSNTKGVGF